MLHSHITHIHRDDANAFYVQILHGMHQSQEIPQNSKPCMTAHGGADPEAEYADLRIWTMVMIILHINFTLPLSLFSVLPSLRVHSFFFLLISITTSRNSLSVEYFRA